ncbi:MAG: hypothetical protein KGD65_01670 [Candidatus Lokiarchaeota archaeon]|nr:hypothetical protein [Candidatus Lokiarchaeota archaeon]
MRVTTNDKKCPLFINLRGLRAKNIDNFIWSNGILIRSSTIRPKIIKATFECALCGSTFEVIQLTSRIKWPNFCINQQCKAKTQSDFRLISKSSEFIDWQSIMIQEIPEDLPPGRIPRSVQAILTHDLVDSVKPGDRIKLMGTYKSVLAQSTQSYNSTLFKTFIDVNFIDPEDKSEHITDLSKEDKKKIEELSKEPMIQKKIARSISPSIYGRDQLKMACALSLFGGTRRKKLGGGYKRGDLHFLVVGDPGTGKSEILKGAVDVSPRGLYTSGKGSTGVGLTAAVIKEGETGQMNLEAGVVVLANGGIAAIDEFDKMDTADRSALHEAMEQQSYHYNTEILSADGRRIVIGEFINKLMKQNKDKIIYGKDCEILPFNDLKIFTSDFKKIFKTNVDRVSRHKAPTHFYKITFTNGRSIIVTPEHPIFAFREGILSCICAKDCVKDDFIPIPKYLPNSSDIIELHDDNGSNHPLAKELTMPRHLTPKLGRVLGYIVSEGHSYKGSGAEIGFSNMDDILLKDFYKLMKDEFNIEPSINERDDGLKTLRYISVNLYEWMIENFPEVMTKSKFKRAPNKILSSSRKIIKEFLISAFKGDGSVESTAICYRTASKGLCADYQDLLLKLGLHSRITYDKYNDSYKVYIRAQSLIQFYEEIIQDNDHRIKKIRNLIKPDRPKTHHHDIFPNSIIEMIINLKHKLAITYDGYFHRHLKENHGITRNVFQKELTLIKHKFLKILKTLDKNIDIQEIRDETGYSQAILAQITGLNRSNIDYYERGGYDKKQRENCKLKIVSALKTEMKKVEAKINYLNSLIESDIYWDRIKQIECIQNKEKIYTPWVYDITVEPNHTFISQGIVLHNTVSIAKAGIVATLKAQTAIIAAANPHSGRYDRYKTPTQNIRLPPSLLSRFDLIFVVVDRPNSAEDAQMAEFILKNAMIKPEEEFDDHGDNTAPIHKDLLKKYIKHAKRTCHPILSDEAKERIKEFYLELRGQYDSEDAIISILARNLDALVRLSEAYAKMALRDKVTKEDVGDIMQLFKRFLKDTGYDETSGKIDMDRIFVGQSRSNLNRLEALMNRLKEIYEENSWKPLERINIIQILDLEEKLDKKFIENAIEELIKEGTLYEPKSGFIKFTNKESL